MLCPCVRRKFVDWDVPAAMLGLLGEMIITRTFELLNLKAVRFFLGVQVCENLARYGWKKVWIEDQKCPYAYGGDQWVGYDDPRSLRIKVQNDLLVWPAVSG